jgi:molybdenum cofactor cytidylyltransferase
MTFAVVPAAGRSDRMGRPKLSLPLGDRTVLEHVLTALRDGGVGHTIVVIGPDTPELVPLATAAGATAHLLSEPTPDMRTTVDRGLRWLEENARPRPADVWLLTPGDHPGISADTVRAVLAAAERRSIVIPVCDGRRGHPTALAWRHVPAIRALPADAGINSFLRQQEVFELPVDDPGIVTDIDTPEQYAARQLRVAIGSRLLRRGIVGEEK